MKKALYGSTALVAAGAFGAVPAAAEEGVTVGVSGYLNTMFGVLNVDDDAQSATVGTPRDFGNTAQITDGEVHFKGKTTLDNGITFGVQIELESQATGDQIDENYAFVEGSFGRFVIGGENQAAYQMHYAAPSVGQPLNSGWQTAWIPAPQGVVDATGAVVSFATGFRRPSLSTYVDFGNDEHSITYYTPRFSGFQFGASYAPAVAGTGDGQNRPANKNAQLHDMWAVGANYVQSFDGIDVAVSGGLAGASSTNGSGADDPLVYSVGVNLGFGGFTVGGSWAQEDSDTAQNGWGASAGVSYATGPWSVGIDGFLSETDGTGADDQNLTSAQIGVGYQVGPGIS
ncbi:MAG: porin, partial [Pseudomonadota bacterium]